MSRMQTSNLLLHITRAALLAAATCIASQSSAADNLGPSSAPAAGPAPQNRIDKLIEQLGDGDYHVRCRAQNQLAKIGFDAFDALSSAENHDDPEVAARARYLLRLLQVDFVTDSDSKQVRGILANYRAKSHGEKLEAMRNLAALPKAQGLAPLCRLIRFQRSELLSKHAAIAILQWQTENPAMAGGLGPLLQKQLGTSRRPSTQWLFGSLQFANKPTEALARWTEFVRQESDLLHRGDPRTDKQVVEALIHYDIQWTFALNLNKQQKADAFERLLSMRRKDAVILLPLVPWLIEQEAWKTIGKKPAELAEAFAADPRQTLYSLAQSLIGQGKTEQAEQAAGWALKLDFGDDDKEAVVHFEMAYRLQRQGLFDWAGREYQRSIDCGDDEELICLAYSYLAEMHHDQSQDSRAAAVINTLIERLEAQKEKKKPPTGKTKI